MTDGDSEYSAAGSRDICFDQRSSASVLVMIFEAQSTSKGLLRLSIKLYRQQKLQ